MSITALALALAIASFICAEEIPTYEVDVAGPLDELFIRDGWFPKEGPYEMYGDFWRHPARWATQGATIRIPVFPGAENTLELRCLIASGENQRLRLFVNGTLAAELPHSEDYIYRFYVGSEFLDDSGWADLKIETDIPGPRQSGDGRDLRAAVDWIEISAKGQRRDYLAEALAGAGFESVSAGTDRPPKRWRFRHDPNNTGNQFGIQDWSSVTYDDSGWKEVDGSFVPSVLQGEAVWYRAWCSIDRSLDAVKSDLRLPCERLEDDGTRQVWVNGIQVVPKQGQSLRDCAARALREGVNVLVVKAIRGPLPRTQGQEFVETPRFEGRWTTQKVRFKPGEVVLKPGFEEAKRVSVSLVDPAGTLIGSETRGVVDLGQGRNGIVCRGMWDLNTYGRYAFVVEDDRGHRREFPVHFLGVHLYHWGWYSAHDGTQWLGFRPGSNDYIDQLFARLDDWSRPHHSISWGGTILEPGTGFHKTKDKDYVSLHRDAIKDERLGFVGSTFAPRNVCTDFGESLLRGMRLCLKLYESQLGHRPTRFTSHDSTFTPMLPQIMRLCDYDTYVAPENWWGQGSIPGSRDCIWSSADGTSVRCLDSWYHGTPVGVQARRAIEQGKPAVLCNEEFACLDATVFLNDSELRSLAAEGIFLQPISLDAYQKATEEFAGKLVYRGDDGLRYKGWTGGGEGEVEYEKANRLLETRLVALENLAALARWLGTDIDQKPIDDWWNLSMRWHECHNHWGNGYPALTQKLWEGVAFADQEMRRIGELIAGMSEREGPRIVVFNPLGFARSGLCSVELPGDRQSLAADSRHYPLQSDPDRPGAALAWLPELPSIGYRSYELTNIRGTAKGVSIRQSGSCVELFNDSITVRVSPDGSIDLQDAAGAEILSRAHSLYLAKSRELETRQPLSAADNPLNPAHYSLVEAAGPIRTVCSGPVLAAVECDLKSADHPAVAITIRVSLAGDERQARVRLSARFAEPTALCPPGAPGPHEGTYFPGFFVALPFPAEAKPVVDMAYCTTESALEATNQETFLKQPFRNATFNALSMAGPESGKYWVLTRGLTDFFVVRRPVSYMGLSLGVGTAGLPFKDEYTHEYAIYSPPTADRERSRRLAYRAAQAFLVEPFSLLQPKGTGTLPGTVSLVGVSDEAVIIPGVQTEDGELLIRLLNLSLQKRRAVLDGLVPFADPVFEPQGSVSARRDELPPRALREIRQPVR